MSEKQIPRSTYYTRWGQLKNERATWWQHWREISDNLLPRSGRFYVQDRNKGWRRHNAIYDSTGTRALRTLAAGLMSGMTSPARPWFRLATHDPTLMQQADVKQWLSDLTSLILTIFQRSNTYRVLHSMYEELGAFGTAAAIAVPDYDNVIHLFPLTTGEYCIATDWRGEVCTLYREFQKPVSEVVKEFGLDNCSQATQALYQRGSLDAWVQLVHAIEPRADRDPSKKDAKNMAWRSVYFELNGSGDKPLRESGYRKFPALCPRWAVSGGDIYGNSPGMEALGDVKQLQHEQLRKAQGIDYQTKPPLQVPSALKNKEVETLPGGITYYDATTPHNGIRSAFEVNLNLQYLLEDIQDVRQRINGTFYADLFLMLANQQDTRMTATEVSERHEEKLLMLGPVLERLQNELLDPLIELTFDAIMDAGIMPPPPQSLQGNQLNVELVSMLAQAQRAIATNSIDRFVGSMTAVAQVKPDVLDKFDSDSWAELYADSLGLDPHLIVPDEQVQALRQARAQQAAQQQKADQANQNADTVQKLANASSQPNLPNQLQNLMPTHGGDATSPFSGYT